MASSLRELNLDPFGQQPQRIPIYRDEPEFVDRVRNNQNYPVINNPDGSVSTHRMAAESDANGNWYVFPTIQMQDGELVEYYDSRDAMDAAFKTGNILRAPNKQSALNYAEGAYKRDTGLGDRPVSTLRGLQELSPSDPLYIHQDPMPVGADIMTQQEAISELGNREMAARAAGTVSPFESSFNPFNPNFRATAQNAISNMLGGSNISSNPNYLQGRIANTLSGLVDFIPAVGDAVGVGDTMTSYRQGDMLGTGINAAATGIGVLPLVGGPASKAVKAGGNKVRSALRGIDPSLPKYEGMRDATVQHLKNKGIMSQREFDRAERDSFEKTGNWDSMPEPEAVYTIDDSGSNSSYVTIKKPKNYAEEGMGDPDEYTIRFSDHSLPKQYAYDQNIYNVSDDYYDETINGKTLNDAIDYADRLVPSSSVALGETPSVRDGVRSALRGELPTLTIGDTPLAGAPSLPRIPERGLVRIGPNPEVAAAAQDYSQRSGIPSQPIVRYASVDEPRATQIAREYDLMRHDPQNPEVKRSYDAMIEETLGQYDSLLARGIEPYFINDVDPYKNSPYEALIDLEQNKRLGIFPTRSGFGSDVNFDPRDNPLLGESGYNIGGQPALNNDIFRFVHDAMGHGRGGVGFRAMGEENAYQSHAGMYSPLARRALASETRGQNSFLNYGPNAEANRTASVEDTIFADQKTGLMPRHSSESGLIINDNKRERFFDALRRGETGLEGAITDDGKLQIIHRSNQPIERVDPEMYGQGLSRRSAERNRAGSPDFVKRSYYGIPASENPYRREMGIGSIQNEVLIEPELLYDARKDPDKLWIPNDPTGSEKRIADSNYTGYFVDDPKIGKVAAIFDPYDSTKTFMIPLVAGATALSALREVEEEPI